MSSQPEVFILTAQDAPEIARLLAEARPAYVGHFHPFPFSTEAIAERLGALRRDRWWGLRWQGAPAGLFFLRGFDEGYARPAFGLFVAEAFASRGFGRFALQYALDWCRAEPVQAVMLKVHPENFRARKVYEGAGFQPIGICPQTGEDVMELRLEASTPRSP